MYIQLNNINLKLKTVRGDSGCASKSCCTTECNYIVKKKQEIALYMSKIIVDVHNFILGWKIVYLSAQHLSFCQYSLYRELIIAIDRTFSFRLLYFVKQTPLQTHRCNLVYSWSGLLYEQFCTDVRYLSWYLWALCFSSGVWLHSAHILNARPWEHTVF